MENTIIKQQELKDMPQPIASDTLLAALYFFWDAFERATLNFFLIKETARQVIKGEDLVSDRLTIGLRKNEWNGGQSRVFRAFMEHENILPAEKTKDYIKFIYQDVPVYLYFYDENPCLDSFDIVFYKNETFNIPNPYLTFCQTYDK